MTASSSKSRFPQGIKFPKVLAAAGLAAVLVGCGGGSSDDTMMGSNPDSIPDPGPAPAELQARRIQSAISTSQSAIGQLVPAASDGQIAIAETALAKLGMAIDDATDLSEDVLDGYMTTYEAHKLLLNNSKSGITVYRDEEEKKGLAREKKIRDDHAKLWIASINDYKPATAVEPFSSLASHVTDLDIDDQNNIELDDESGDPISPMNHMSPLRGWTAKRFIKTDDKSYGVVVTNNSELPRPTRYSWAEHFYTDHPRTTSPRATTNFLTSMPGVTALSGGRIQFLPGNDFNKMQFGGNRPDKILRNQTLRATFNGVPGVLSCTGGLTTECTTLGGTNDTIFQFQTGYTFTPDPKNDTHPLDNVFMTITPKIDTSHLAFGYWITETSRGSQGMSEYNINTFAEDYDNGYGPVTTSVSVLEGSASYSGGAVGVYVLKENVTDANPDLYNGEFVAGVDLNAQFDDMTGSVALRDQWKITGTIDSFRSSTDASHNLRGWELTLEADLGADRGATNPGEMDTPSFALSNPVTMGGGAAGTWNASFFGDGDGDGDADDHPDAIAGQFNGHFVNGHVVGAFGAEKKD